MPSKNKGIFISEKLHLLTVNKKLFCFKSGTQKENDAASYAGRKRSVAEVYAQRPYALDPICRAELCGLVVGLELYGVVGFDTVLKCSKAQHCDNCGPQ